MTSEILEMTTKEKLILKNWSQKVEEMERYDITDYQNSLCEIIKENIRNKMQLIEDLEFEALENQISLEDSQRNTTSSIASSPQSHSLGSDFVTGSSVKSDDSFYTSEEKSESDKFSNIRRVSENILQQSQMLSLNDIVNQLYFCGYHNDETSYPMTDKNELFPKMHPTATMDISSSITSSTEPSNISSKEISSSKLSRNHNQSSSVRSQDSNHNNKRPRQVVNCFPGIDDPKFNLKLYIDRCGHNVASVEKFIKLDTDSCGGHLWKLSGKRIKLWKRRSFIFDRNRRIFAYYSNGESTKVKGVISFDQIVNVRSLSDRSLALNSIIPGDVRHTFAVQLNDNYSRGRTFKDVLKLSAHSLECQRIWMDVILTGCEGYLQALYDGRREGFSECDDPMEY